MSKKLNAAECNYPAHEMDTLALVTALKYWRPTFGSLHQGLHGQPLLSLSEDMRTEIAKTGWMSLIESYGVKIAHIPGTTNTAADSHSRPRCDINPLLPVDPMEDWKRQYETLDLPLSGYAP